MLRRKTLLRRASMDEHSQVWLAAAAFALIVLACPPRTQVCNEISKQYRPLGECTQEPLLFTYRELRLQGIVRVCHRNVCSHAAIGDTQNFRCNLSQQQQALLPLYRLNVLHSISRLSKLCNLTDQIPSNSNQLDNLTVSCTMPSTTSDNQDHVTCTMLGVNMTWVSEGTFGYVEAPESNWTSSGGSDTSEFKNGLANISLAQACSKSIETWLLPGSTDSSFLNVIHIRAISLLERFVQAHANAFDMEHSPPTDMLNVLSLVFSTALSVWVSCGGITKCMTPLLEWTCRSCQWLVAIGLALMNAIFTVLFLLPLIYLTVFSEDERQKRFSSWDMGSGDVGFDSEMHLRIIFFLEGESKYISKNKPIGLAVTVIVTVVVFLFTLCKLGAFLKRETSPPGPSASSLRSMPLSGRTDAHGSAVMDTADAAPHRLSTRLTSRPTSIARTDSGSTDILLQPPTDGRQSFSRRSGSDRLSFPASGDIQLSASAGRFPDSDARRRTPSHPTVLPAITDEIGLLDGNETRSV